MREPVGLIRAAAWVAFAALLACGSQATAAATFDLNASLTSDNRFRGESISNRRPAFEANASVSTAAGWFGALSVASLGEARALGPAGGRTPEIDVSAGWSRSFGVLTPAVGIIGYTYPGGHGGDHAEGFAALTGALGPATVVAGVNYAPAQGLLRRDNVYVCLSPSIEVPRTPLTLRASVGREAGALQGGAHAKLDYGASVEARVARRVTVSVKWSGNDMGAAAYDRRMARGGVAVGVGVGF